jgi:hypothetical protein
MALDDQIEAAVRRDLRQVETDRLSFEIARGSFVAAARAVEYAEENQRFAQPAQPGAGGGAGAQDAGPLKVLRAYDDLLTNKNNLIGTWVSYESDRIQLLLNLEALQLDEREVDTNDSDDQSAESAPTPNPLRSRDAGRPDGVESGRPAGQALP